MVSEELEKRLTEALRARQPRRVELDDARAAAVLIPVVGGNDPSLIFTVRTETLPSHKGQISFPGGSIDTGDPSAEVAALREAEEEIGLQTADVKVIGELDSVPTFVSGYVISPFVGWIERTPELRPNPAEVAEVLHVPLAELVDDIRREPGFMHANRVYPTEAWIWQDHVIWGVTARLLRMFLRALARAGIVEPPGRTSSWTAWPLERTKQ